MNFRRRNSDFAAGGRGAFLTGASITLVILVILSLSGPKSFLFAVSRPFWEGKNLVASWLSNLGAIARTKESLAAENASLAAELSAEKADAALVETLQNENAGLKAALGRKTAGKNGILAAVLAKPPFSPYDTLVIDAGTADGVAAGDQVVADGFVPIGFVSETFAHESKATLYSSSGVSTRVLVGSSSIETLATGMGGGALEIRLPSGSDVAVGDAVSAPSISTNIVGTVESVASKPSDSLETVLVSLPVNIANIRFVEIVSPSRH
ncbi:MAG: rod shape-determining protein MreC [Patescibacteria group bacterium]|nr:rod shape-determining protein MreC [Patescibacteria group bacterium]MDE1946021.1 rod shape-determining protein MreC [Patescibacteria group bacterium]